MKDKLIIGYPDSGLEDYIRDIILAKENISTVKYLSCVDILILDHTKEIDFIKEKLEYHSMYSSLELNNKYCICSNLDFCSLEKQETFLKYVEDSSIQFYFTCFNVNRIYSQALISRLSKQHSTTVYTLSSTLKLVYREIENDFKYSSMSQRYIWFNIHSSVKGLIKYKDDYFMHLESILNALSKIDKYPEWYIASVAFEYVSSSILDSLKDHKSKYSVISKIISQYLKSDLDTFINFEMFLHSTYLAIYSYNQLNNG